LAHSHLHGCTPIAYQAHPEPAVVWADLRHHRFGELSFRRIVAAAREASPVIRTNLAALAALDDQPSLDPNLIIAHPSRCGSTLLARLAASAHDAHLLSEPPVLLQLLQHNLAGGLDRPVAQVLRQVVRAFGHLRLHDGQRCVLKLNSQMTRFLPEFRKAFPNVPVIWLQRRPAEIVESNLSCPPRRSRPLSSGTMADWAVRRVTLAFMAAKVFVDDRVEVLDYCDLPDTAWIRIANIMGFDPVANAARMRELVAVDSKTGKTYLPRLRQTLPGCIKAIVRDTLDPIYRHLDLRRGA
jgi:hypothetical protein